MCAPWGEEINRLHECKDGATHTCDEKTAFRAVIDLTWQNLSRRDRKQYCGNFSDILLSPSLKQNTRMHQNDWKASLKRHCSGVLRSASYLKLLDSGPQNRFRKSSVKPPFGNMKNSSPSFSIKVSFGGCIKMNLAIGIKLIKT